MAYTKHTLNQEVVAVDIHGMAEMTEAEYEEYLRNDLLYVDHHEVLRSMAAGYPLAVTRRQYQMLLAYLRTLESQVGGGIVKE